jgi:hypothetical protein
VLRDRREAPGAVARLARPGDRLEIEALEEDAQHRPHLETGEAGAEAAARAAAERDQRVGDGLALEEALGAERPRVLKRLRRLDAADRRHDDGAGRQPVAAQLERLAEDPPGDLDHGPRPLGLVEDGVQVGLAVAGADLCGEALARGPVVREALEAEGQRARRRLVPGKQQRHQLILELGVGQRRPVLGPGGDEQRQHVVAALRLGAVGGDLLPDQTLRLGPGADRGLQPPEPAAAEGREAALHDHRQRVRLQHLRQRRPQAVGARPLGDAEHGPQDRLERDPLHRGMDRELGADRPAAELGDGDLLDQAGVALDRLAVERRQQQLAQRHVLGAVLEHHRPRADRG